MVCDDRELFSIRHTDRALRKDRTANLVHRAAGTDGIKSHRAQHIPRRCLSAIVVPRNSKRPISIPDIHQLANAPLRLPWLSGEIIEIRNVVAGLVALRIKPYQARGVRKLAEVFILRRSILLDKELIQLGIEILTPPHQANQTCNVMLYVEGISPRIHLGEVIPAALPSAKLWIKGRHPLPICALRSHEAYLRIEDIAIVVSQL